MFVTAQLILLIILSYNQQHQANAQRVCGYYCGPTWCANTSIDETACVKEDIWGIPSDGGCADSCCRLHDYCCALGDRPACNAALVACIGSINCIFTPCGSVVWIAMNIINTWCCGERCTIPPMQIIQDSFNDTLLDLIYSEHNLNFLNNINKNDCSTPSIN